VSVIGDDGREYESREEERRVLTMEEAAPDMLEALKAIDAAWKTGRNEPMHVAIEQAVRPAIDKAESKE